jgi:ribonuclease P protein component
VAASARSGSRRRLSRSAEFDRVVRQGRSLAGRDLVLHSFPRPSAGEDAEPRLGVSVGRRVGGAVERNRVKRLLREAFWALAPDLPGDCDYVIVARASAAALARERGLAGITEALRELVPASEGEPAPGP